MTETETFLSSSEIDAMFMPLSENRSNASLNSNESTIIGHIRSYSPLSGTIVEVCGKAGSGKSAVLQMIAVEHVMKSHGKVDNKNVALVVVNGSQEEGFWVRRLNDMIANRGLDKEILENICFCKVNNYEDLKQKIDPAQYTRNENNISSGSTSIKPYTIESVLDNPSINPEALIILDCIPALVRNVSQEGEMDFFERSCLFFQLCGKLKKLSSKFRAPCFVSNQVTGSENGDFLRPALGPSWENNVNVRVMLEKGASRERGGRWMWITKSGVKRRQLRKDAREFYIEKSGVEFVENK